MYHTEIQQTVILSSAVDEGSKLQQASVTHQQSTSSDVTQHLKL